MAEFKCVICGKKFTGANVSRDYLCCSLSCAAVYRNRKRAGYDPVLDWKKEGNLWVCPYHVGIGCKTRNCKTCGWNPEVEKRRKNGN